MLKRGVEVVTKLYGWLRAAGRASRLIRSRVSVPRPNTWIASLEQVIADLSSLNQSTEQDFLQIGGKLMGFRQTVKLVSTDLTALTDLISGEQGSHASQALANALARSKEMGARTEKGSGVLRTIREAARQVRSGFSESNGRVAVFRTLAVLTRIETARLGSVGAGFGNLADEVQSMAESIRTGVEGALETAAGLVRPVESALQNAAALQARQSTNVSSVMDGVLASLQSLRDRRQAARDTSLRLASQYDAVSDSMGKMVVSIQFHDITRQQVEHVIDTLKHVCSECGTPSGSPSPTPRAVAILALQASQLADAQEKFAGSVAHIERNLESIAARVSQMAAESQTLFGLSQDERNSFFLDMERCCTVILDAVGNCADAEAGLQATAGRLKKILDRMRRAIEEVRSAEVQMRRMALNAGIRAAHLGYVGDALSVLAGSLQDLGAEISRSFEAAFEALDAMSASAAQLSIEAGAHDGQAILQREMRATIEELHSSDERSLALITHIRTTASRLSEEISTIRAAFSAGRLFAEVISRSRATLLGIEAEARPGPAADDARSQDQGLGDLVRRYTMQAEHAVHEEALGRAAPVPVPVEVRGPGQEETEGLGDNVDLF